MPNWWKGGRLADKWLLHFVRIVNLNKQVIRSKKKVFYHNNKVWRRSASPILLLLIVSAVQLQTGTEASVTSSSPTPQGTPLSTLLVARQSVCES